MPRQHHRDDDGSDPPEHQHLAPASTPALTFGTPVELAPLLPPPAGAADLPPPSAALSLIATQRDAMARVFQQNGLTIASLQLEMLAVARAAAADGEYQASAAIYKVVAQTLGAVAGERHLHVHQQQPQAGAQQAPTDYRSTPDSELRALIERARQARAAQQPVTAEPIETTHAVAG